MTVTLLSGYFVALVVVVKDNKGCCFSFFLKKKKNKFDLKYAIYGICCYIYICVSSPLVVL